MSLDGDQVSMGTAIMITMIAVAGLTMILFGAAANGRERHWARIGKCLLNHSFMLSGLVTMVSANCHRAVAERDHALAQSEGPRDHVTDGGLTTYMSVGPRCYSPCTAGTRTEAK